MGSDRNGLLQALHYIKQCLMSFFFFFNYERPFSYAKFSKSFHIHEKHLFDNQIYSFLLKCPSLTRVYRMKSTFMFAEQTVSSLILFMSFLSLQSHQGLSFVYTINKRCWPSFKAHETDPLRRFPT